MGLLELANRVADEIGHDVPKAYWASFGKTNVKHYEVATRVELGELGDAAYDLAKDKLCVHRDRWCPSSVGG
ncbi:hypothetical protein [Streptomyces sp. NPDC051662]|uniref:hypothetical protein n=1 Tax=Streptomyces sp. NPDC051662 TaxID=3154750 RepID=UPI003445C682